MDNGDVQVRKSRMLGVYVLGIIWRRNGIFTSWRLGVITNYCIARWYQLDFNSVVPLLSQ